ncbi:MAG: hypothetical protein ACOC44_03530 [Promethearchaeia archaeon]
MNSVSSHISHKILLLYHSHSEGINLTGTSKLIKEKISTTQDHLNKLLSQGLIYRRDNDYFLSSFGQYLLKQLQHIARMEKSKLLFGKIPKGLIPPEIVDKLCLALGNCTIIKTSWNFMNTMDEYINDMKKNLKKTPQYLGVIGWWSLEYDFEMLKMHFPNIDMNSENLKKFLKHFKMKMVTHKAFLNEIKNHKLLGQLLNEEDLLKNFRIYEGIDRFNFCVLRFNRVLGIFLTDKTDIDFQNNLFFKNNEGALEFFEELLDFYWERSTPLKNFL